MATLQEEWDSATPLQSEWDSASPSVKSGDSVPKWAERNPTAYAVTQSALDMLPMAANVIKSSVIGIPVAGAINVATQAIKRTIDDQPTTGKNMAVDFGVGMLGQGVGDAIGKGLFPVIAKALPKSLPEWLYKSAVKPSTVTPLADRKAIIERGLNEGITLDAAGWEKLLKNIAQDRSIVMDTVNSGSARAETIPVQSVIDEFNLGGDKSLNYLSRILANDAPEVGSAVSARSATLRKNGTDIDVKKAQTLKEHYQNQSSYPLDTRGMYDEQLDQATARGFRKALENKYPPELIKIPNANNAERNMLAEQLSAKGTLGRIENRDPTGLGMTVAAGTFDMSNPITQANLVARTVQNFPKLQAKIAIDMYKAKTGKVLPIKKYRDAVRYLVQEELIRNTNQMNNQQSDYMAPIESQMLTPDKTSMNDTDPLGIRNAG